LAEFIVTRKWQFHNQDGRMHHLTSRLPIDVAQWQPYLRKLFITPLI